MLSDRAMSTRGKGKPVDELDSICKQYKECVHCTKLEFGQECIPEFVKYEWEVNGSGNVVSKGNSPGTCKRSLFECDHLYAKTLAETQAMKDFTTDYHGYWTTIGWKHEDECFGGGGVSEPECCGGFDKPYFLYNSLNKNKVCCADGTIKKEC